MEVMRDFTASLTAFVWAARSCQVEGSLGLTAKLFADVSTLVAEEMVFLPGGGGKQRVKSIQNTVK